MPKPKPLATYILKIERDGLNITGTGFEPETKIDTIKAENDTTAYTDAVRTFYSHKIAENTAKNKVFKTHSFTIQDSSGLYLDLTLPKTVVDSINEMIKKLSVKMESNLKS